MKVFTLHRMVDGPDFTLGRMEDEQNNVVCVTAERAWVDKNGDGFGDNGVSRIPPGTYECNRDTHGKLGPHPYEVWEIGGVPGRSEIHIHIGNVAARDSKGCPLVGTAFGPNGSVTGSGDAFRKWMKATEGESKIVLVVKDVPPLSAERVA
jgi:hypothetical protein